MTVLWWPRKLQHEYGARPSRGPGKVERSCLEAALKIGLGLSLLHLVSWFYVFDIEPSGSHFVAMLAAGLLFLLLGKRFLLGAVLLLGAFSPRLVSAATRIEKSDLAIALIAAAFLLMAAGLAINLRSSARASSGVLPETGEAADP